MRRFDGKKLVLASHNGGKLAEIRRLLSDLPIEVISAQTLGLEESDETGTSFAENARIKALGAAKAAKLPALADDSGLAVAALGGQPGIYSARWAGPEKDFSAAMARIEGALKGMADRRAAFIAHLTLAWPDGAVVDVEECVEGVLVWPPRGERGFGYDPMFQPEAETRTFGEMTSEEKARWSHRARALRSLRERCF